nr:hypothetical protein Iba_chr15fCG4640 [Ipomoea batatas]
MLKFQLSSEIIPPSVMPGSLPYLYLLPHTQGDVYFIQKTRPRYSFFRHSPARRPKSAWYIRWTLSVHGSGSVIMVNEHSSMTDIPALVKHQSSRASSANLSPRGAITLGWTSINDGDEARQRLPGEFITRSPARAKVESAWRNRNSGEGICVSGAKARRDISFEERQSQKCWTGPDMSHRLAVPNMGQQAEFGYFGLRTGPIYPAPGTLWLCKVE